MAIIEEKNLVSKGITFRPMSKNINVKERDLMRENLFKSEYKVDTKIKVTNYNDDNWNWDMVVLNFKDSLGKDYGLIEFFKPGNDNSTDHVLLEYCDKSGNWIQEEYKEFHLAEKAMVNLMQRRLRGED